MNVVVELGWTALAVMLVFPLAKQHIKDERALVKLAILSFAGASLGLFLPYSWSWPKGEQAAKEVVSCLDAHPGDELALGNLDIVYRKDAATKNFANGAHLQSREVYHLAGWAADEAKEHPALGVCAMVDGAIIRAAFYARGGPRPDVVEAYGSPALVDSAFDIALPPQSLSPGPHRISVVTLRADGTTARLGGERAVLVR